MTKPLVSLRRLEQILGRDRKDISRLANKAGRYYSPFDVRKVKGDGKWRHIDNPSDELKFLQRRIQKSILSQYDFPNTMFGSIKGRSLVGCASQHIAPLCLVTLDIKDYFMNIHDKNVYQAYCDAYGCSSEIADTLTKLTTFQHRIPQGAPTSSALANAVSLKMHFELREMCDKYGLNLSCYVDDIAFSGERALEAIEPIIQVIQKYGFSLKRKKMHKMPAFISQKVTGLTVNRVVSVGRTYREALMRNIISYSGEPSIKSHERESIMGKINYVKQTSSHQGAVLAAFAAKNLPNIIIEGVKPHQGEIRSCNNVRRHTKHP